MKPILTDQQKKVLGFVVDHLRSTGHPPTIREIAAAFRFRSTGTVRDHLRALEAKGQLRTLRGKSRGIIPQSWSVLMRRSIPILGRVPAGGPLLAEENLEGTVDLSREFGGDQVFALQVVGDSMDGAGIREGDLAVVRAQPEAEPGQIVVALVDGEATVKTLASRGSKRWLEPANPRYRPIPVTGHTRIVGRVIGVIRRYERRF